MSRKLVRLLNASGLSVLMLLAFGTVTCRSATPPAPAAHTARQDLLGAWRLESIEISSPGGPKPDPFYNDDPTGILMYEASGWMSVQIVGQPRSSLKAAATRPPHKDSAEVAQQKSAAFDTYYAYFGTWDFDAANSTVTHHIKSSLIPGESGMSYSQTVTVQDDTLIFTSKRESTGVATVQKKVWRRIRGSER